MEENNAKEKHERCKSCYFKNDNQNPKITKYNNCSLCLFNTSAIKTNNFKDLPTARKRA